MPLCDLWHCRIRSDSNLWYLNNHTFDVKKKNTKNTSDNSNDNSNKVKCWNWKRKHRMEQWKKKEWWKEKCEQIQINHPCSVQVVYHQRTGHTIHYTFIFIMLFGRHTGKHKHTKRKRLTHRYFGSLSVEIYVSFKP